MEENQTKPADKETKPTKGFNPIYAIAIIVAIAIAAVAAYFLLAHGSAPGAQMVAIGDNVSVYYTGTFTNGTVFDTNVGKPPLNFTVGAGQVIQGFDNAVVGMKVNQTKNVTIPPNQAYGNLNPGLIVDVPLTEFGNSTVHVGMAVTENARGQLLQGVVTAVNSTTAKVNFNPPLAGDTLLFKITVASIHKKQ